ncbi:MAG: DUF3592 domain-containing protein [Pirellulales bacterium]
MSDSVDSGVARGFLRFGQIVGLFLLLAAVYRVSPIVTYLWDAARMRAWEEVPATVLEADYRNLEEDDIRPRVFAEYRYTYGGVEYQGSRVDIAASPELVGEFQKQMADELKQHVNDGTPTTAYVNPSQPEDSVLYPRFIYTAFAARLLILFVFAFFGGLLFWLMTYALRRQKQQVIEERTHPEEPWLWRHDWANKLIRSSSYKLAWLVVLFAAIYLLVALPLALLVLQEWGRDILSVPGVILMLVGLAFFNAARLQLKVGKTFRGAEFRMSSVPGVIGGSLAGVVVLPQKMPDDTKFRVVLECAEYQHTRKNPKSISVGQSRSESVDASEHIVWRENVVVERTLSVPDPNSTALPVYFSVPFECKPSGLTETMGIRWRVKAGIEEPNFHRYATFEVPVFKTAESSPDFQPDLAVMQPFEAVVDAKVAIERMCRIEPLPNGGEKLRFSYTDYLVLVIALVVVAVCAGGVAAVFHFEAHPAWALVPGLFGLVIFLATSAMLLWGSSLAIQGDRVTVASGYAGMRKRFEVPLSEILDVEIEHEQRTHEQDHYCLNLKFRVPVPLEELEDEDNTPADLDFLRNEKYTESLTIAKRLESRQQAEAVRRWLCEKLRFTDDQIARSIPLSSPELEVAHDDDL